MDDPLEIAHAVVVGIAKGGDPKMIDDGVFVPVLSVRFETEVAIRVDRRQAFKEARLIGACRAARRYEAQDQNRGTNQMVKHALHFRERALGLRRSLPVPGNGGGISFITRRRFFWNAPARPALIS